jgi:putative endonuclease
MYYVYVLESIKDGKWYIGHSEDPERRLEEHNSGRTISTKHRRPFKLLYKEPFRTRSEARWQERKWKTGSGHKALEKILESYCSLK